MKGEKKMICDLCGKTIEGIALHNCHLDEMQQAVRDGFNPWKTPGIDMSSSSALGTMFGMSDDEIFATWRQKLMADTSNPRMLWHLCIECGKVFWPFRLRILVAAGALNESSSNQEKTDSLTRQDAKTPSQLKSKPKKRRWFWK
jgi:hypothetical protein